jgi:hypothetical protein
MKVIAALLLSLSLPALHRTPEPRTPVDHTVAKQPHHHGSWYFAENGHAVYCYGPVVVVPISEGTLQRVATFCRGHQTMVPLKD